MLPKELWPMEETLFWHNRRIASTYCDVFADNEGSYIICVFCTVRPCLLLVPLFSLGLFFTQNLG
jgi:hypothetical protein